MKRKNLSIVSLGCFRNTYDSETVLNRFLEQGYSFSSRENIFLTGKDNFKSCDTLLVNTCGFIDRAKEESIEFIRQAVRLKKEGKVKSLFVFGCLVERYQEKLKASFPEVDKWWGTENFPQNEIRQKKIMPAHLDFIKICEGCLNKCTYCTIPQIKGDLRSKPKEQIINEVKFLDKKGIKELNIIGQDITSWAKDLKTKDDLSSLLRAILKTTKNISWIRLLYTHPRHVSDKLIDLIANEERICKYIDLPIQHINDRILQLMNRGVTKKQITSLIKKIRKNIKSCVIRTSVMAGFPTETADEFKELLNFLKETRFERLGAFTYSREENTPAFSLEPQVHNKVKLSRFKEIMSLQQGISCEVNKRFLDKHLDVLIEEKDNEVFIGRTQFDAYEVDGVVFLKKKNLKLGKFYKAKIIDNYDYDLVGI
ncbi:MAG: 30S ribosomal protein S12 methylthiotransferase RimO [Candidatus Omnitrophica bacterium]|jgi:ribosomal protein S12 methylthiotransferase|nr:30S ribosomal protein S12 methylthiotransferase RimO [Candidatus Omnitrophota bacterium]